MVPKNENALGKNRLTLGETRAGEIRGRIFNLYDVRSVLLPFVFDLYLLLFWPLTAFIFGRFSPDLLVLVVLLVFDCFILLQGVSNFCRRLGILYQLFNFGARCCPTFFRLSKVVHQLVVQALRGRDFIVVAGRQRTENACHVFLACKVLAMRRW